ncbi:MAG: DUF3857 domain-containing protein [Candidatus Polarisedimenticolia bacterium]
MTPAGRRALVVAVWMASALMASGAVAAEPPEWLETTRRLSLPAAASKAEVVVLLEEVLVEVTRSETRSRVRNAVRINREGGLGRAALLAGQRIGEDFKLVGGWKVRPDGEATTYDRKAIVQIDADTSYQFSMDKVNAFRPEDARVGDVVAWEYVSKSRPEALQTSWEFGGGAPTLLSRFGVKTPPDWTMRHELLNAGDLSPARNDEGYLVWEMRDIPGLPDEPMRVPDDDLVPRVLVAYAPRSEKADPRQFDTWESVARWYAGIATSQVASDDVLRRKAAELGAVGPVLGFARSLRYLDTALGRSTAEPHPAPQILRNMFGDCEDKAILSIALLKEIGVEAWPVLVLTRDDGLVLKSFPGVNAFNHAIVAVRASGELSALPSAIDAGKAGRIVLFDPTSSMTALGDLPYYLQGTSGVLAHPEHGGLIELPRLDPALSSRTSRIDLTFEADRLQARATVVHEGQYAVGWRHHYDEVRGEKRREDLERRLTSRFPNVKVGRLDLQNAETPEAPLRMETELSMKAPGPQGGAVLRMIPVSFLLPTRAATLPAGPRRTPMLVEEGFREAEETRLAIPAGWEVTSAMTAVDASGPSGTYRLEIRREGDGVVMVRELTMRAGRVDTKDYDAMKRFFDDVARGDATTIILEKKPAGS